MDTHHSRSIIIKLQDRLSDSDRERLHFFLGNDVPRRIRDNPTLNGTLNLMDSLFDQDKINERDFTFLINAFNEIQCIDAVKLLREHMKRMQGSSSNQPTLASIMPPLNDQVVQDQEDKSATCGLLDQINKYNNNNNNYEISTKNNTNNNSVTINLDKNRILPKQTQPFGISIKINKYSFFIAVLLMVVLGILMGIFIVKTIKANNVDPRMKDNNTVEEKEKNNRTIHHLNDLVLKKDQQIEMLEKQITALKKKTSSSLVKAGREIGGTDGDLFDDSSLEHFTCTHSLYKIIAYADTDGLESYEFLYRSSHNERNDIQRRNHHNQHLTTTKIFPFGKDEKIHKVRGQIVNKTVVFSNGTNLTIPVITGLVFSSKEMDSISYNGPSGEPFTDKVEGYTLGYATGRLWSHYIVQLQFFWYRTLDA